MLSEMHLGRRWALMATFGGWAGVLHKGPVNTVVAVRSAKRLCRAWYRWRAYARTPRAASMAAERGEFRAVQTVG
jgi:hypothetical protein